MRRTGPAALATALVSLVLVVGSSCGVRSDDGPRTLAADQVPYGLLENAPATTTSTPTRSVPKDRAVVYFVGDSDHLVPVFRDVNRPPTVAKVLTAVLFGVQEDEAAGGLRSAIDPTASVQARALDPATYVVDLSPEFAQGSTSEQLLRIAQLVFTATDIPGVTGVLFTLNGTPIQAPTPAGSTSDPVGKDAYQQFAPLPPNVGGPS
jgi:spore germination protein GerM